MADSTQSCPCGSDRSYDECCGPYIDGGTQAPTAEALMRSRYSAYALHKVDYIIATCSEAERSKIDPRRTRSWSEESTWLGLTILSTDKGGGEDSEGTVEFEARYESGGLRDTHHEKAHFVRTDGVWYYEDGDVEARTVVRASPKVGRNEPCPCGSGKKYKHCHGGQHGGATRPPITPLRQARLDH